MFDRRVVRVNGRSSLTTTRSSTHRRIRVGSSTDPDYVSVFVIQRCDRWTPARTMSGTLTRATKSAAAKIRLPVFFMSIPILFLTSNVGRPAPLSGLPTLFENGVVGVSQLQRYERRALILDRFCMGRGLCLSPAPDLFRISEARPAPTSGASQPLDRRGWNLACSVHNRQGRFTPLARLGRCLASLGDRDPRREHQVDVSCSHVGASRCPQACGDALPRGRD